MPEASAPAGWAERTDEELMAASATGRRDAFEVLVARYLPRLTSYCAKLTRDAGTAEDLAQDTLLTLWHRRASYRPERALRLLVFTMDRPSPLEADGLPYAFDRFDHRARIDLLIGAPVIVSVPAPQRRRDRLPRGFDLIEFR